MSGARGSNDVNAVRHQRRRNRFTADRFDELDAGFELARIERLREHELQRRRLEDRPERARARRIEPLSAISAGGPTIGRSLRVVKRSSGSPVVSLLATTTS